MFAQTLDGQPISAGIGSSQQRAYETLAQSLNLGARQNTSHHAPLATHPFASFRDALTWSKFTPKMETFGCHAWLVTSGQSR